MSDEGMSDAHLKALAGLYKDADDSGMESKWEAIGNALCNAYPLIIARLDAAERERDALREALAKTAQPHFWWDTDDSENGCDDITTILDNYDIGEVVEVSCARNLPNQWAVGYVTESGGFRGQTFATEAEAVAFAAERAALTGAA